MKKVLFIIFLFAICLRLFLFIFCDKSLWLDEAALALNILDKGYLDLFKPLQYAQSAPPLFLYFTKVFVSIFGLSEKVFRFIPFVCSIASIFGFYYLLRMLFCKKDFKKEEKHVQYFIYIVLCSFALNFQLLYNTIEFKPYILDVLFTILAALIWFKYLDKENSLKKQVVFAFLFVLFPLFSFASIFSICTVLLLSLFRKRKLFSIILISGLFLEYIFLFSKINSGTRVYEYWIPYFINFNPLKAIFVLIDIIKYYFYPSSLILLAIVGFITGFIFLYKNDKKIFNFFILIVSGAFLASFLNFYPLYERLSLFLYPIVLIVIVYPLFCMLDKKGGVKKIIIFILTGIFIFSAVFYNFSKLDNHKREEIKPILSRIQEEINLEDRIFVFKGAHLTYRFYDRIFKFKNENYVCSYNTDNNACIEKIKPFCNKSKGKCFIIYSSEIDAKNNIGKLNNILLNAGGKIILESKNSMLYAIN